MAAAGWLSLIIVGVLSGLFATTTHLRRHRMPGGWLAGILTGLVGAYLGGVFPGTWGWTLGGLNMFGSILGALVLSYVVEGFGPRTTPQT